MELIDCGKASAETQGLQFALFFEGGAPPFNMWNGCQPNPCPRPERKEEPAPAGG